MTFYERLVQETQEEKKGLYSAPIIQRALKGEISKDEYILFLNQAYHHVKHTVPLLMACGSRLNDRYEWIKKALTHYIEEEYGHEKWILNDINNAGGDSEKTQNSKADITTEAMVAFAYHQIDRKNPLGFFGMVYVLEGTSTELATTAATKIKESLKLSNKAFSYLLSHGSLDLEHVDFFAELINQVSSEEDQKAIIDSAKSIYKLYGNIFRAIPQMKLN